MSSPSPPRPAGPPRRWKLWILLSCGIYPIILAVETLADPLLSLLNRPGQFALVVPIMVATIVWLVIPLLHRWFGTWMTR